MDLVNINDIKFGDRPDSKNAIERKIKDFEDSIAEALKHFYSFYQPTCRTKEDMRKCENMNR